MNNQNTISSKECVGTDCKITVTREKIKESCTQDKKDLAFFHTHPYREMSFPSFDDVISMYVLDHKFSCIGSKTDIKCFSQNIPVIKAYIDIPSREYDRFKKQWEEHAEDCIVLLPSLQYFKYDTNNRCFWKI